MTRAQGARRSAPGAAAAGLAEATLLTLLEGRRWFGGGERIERARVVAVPVEDGPLRVVVAEVHRTGHAAEHVALVVRDGADGEGLGDPELACRLAALAGVVTPGRSVRLVEGEQSNSSVVLDERHVLKLYRRLEAGPAPEVELLRALTAAQAPHVPLFEGALETTLPPAPTALCAVTALVPSVGDGWTLALDSLATDAGWLPARAHRLGEVTASLHASLGALAGPGLAPLQPPPGTLAELAAGLEREVSEALAALAGRPDAARLAARADDLRALVARRAAAGPCGPAIRTHGDYHLGQVLLTPGDDWVVIDLEGEPGRPLHERRQRRSPLRDVAAMLRSFAYVADAAPRLRGAAPPAGWLDDCRARFLAGYLDAADARLLPPRRAVEPILELFELERLVYELRYELRSRPAWVGIPAAALLRLLGETP